MSRDSVAQLFSLAPASGFVCIGFHLLSGPGGGACRGRARFSWVLLVRLSAPANLCSAARRVKQDTHPRLSCQRFIRMLLWLDSTGAGGVDAAPNHPVSALNRRVLFS